MADARDMTWKVVPRDLVWGDTALDILAADNLTDEDGDMMQDEDGDFLKDG